jgi:hypothetical protein
LRRRLERPLAPDARQALAAELRAHAWPAVFDRYESLYRQLAGAVR